MMLKKVGDLKAFLKKHGFTHILRASPSALTVDGTLDPGRLNPTLIDFLKDERLVLKIYEVQSVNIFQEQYTYRVYEIVP